MNEATRRYILQLEKFANVSMNDKCEYNQEETRKFLGTTSTVYYNAQDSCEAYGRKNITF
jgi:hypothetical protein